MDMGESWSQPEGRVRAFLDWQAGASREELEQLEEWHKEWLTGRQQRLDTDAAMLASNKGWLDDQVAKLSRREGQLVSRPVRLLMGLAVAAIVTGLVFVGGYFFMQGKEEKPRVEGVFPLSAGALLRLSDGREIAVGKAGMGEIARDGGSAIVKRDSGTLVYEGPAGGQVGAAGNTENSLTTDKGGMFQVVLPDGSRVWLNSNSTLRYPSVFGKDSRVVELEGEGYFEVSKDAARPFHLKSRGVDVEVLGTAFDVMAYGDEREMRTTLVEGEVRVVVGGGKVVLQPGEQVSGDSALQVVRPNMEEVLAWRKGEFRFKKEGIESIMRQLQRWYDVTVTYSGSISPAPFSGVMTRKQDPQELLDGLEISGDVHFSVRGKEITVIAGPR